MRNFSGDEASLLKNSSWLLQNPLSLSTTSQNSLCKVSAEILQSMQSMILILLRDRTLCRKAPTIIYI